MPKVERLERRQIQLLPNPGDILSDLTSGIGHITSDIGNGVSSLFDPPAPTSTSTSVEVTTISSSSPSSSLLSSILPPSSVSTPSSTIDGPSSTPAPSSSTTPILQSTVTDILTRTAVLPTETRKNAPKGFLENKALSAFVFALAGLFSLILIFSLATFAIRRRRRKRLLQEAVSFEPASTRMHLDELDQEDKIWNEKNSGDFRGHSGYLEYQAPLPSARVTYLSPSQMVYTGLGREPHDSGSSDHSHTSFQARSGQHSAFRVAPTALPDSFDDGNITGPSVPLKIVNV